MASNISQGTLPNFYSSANDDVIYTFNFSPVIIFSVTNTGGNATINPDISFNPIPVIGEKMHINSNLYSGSFTIIAAAAGAVTIDTPYVGGITSLTYYCYHLRVPNFDLYKGFKGGESLPTQLPYTLVTSIKPSVLYTTTTNVPYLSINLKGVTKHLFTIVANTVSGSVDISMFNAIRLVWDNITTTFSAEREYTLVLNSTISNEDLNYYYVGTGRNLLPIDKPLVATTGVTFASIIVSSGNANDPFPRVYKFLNGVIVP